MKKARILLIALLALTLLPLIPHQIKAHASGPSGPYTAESPTSTFFGNNGAMVSDVVVNQSNVYSDGTTGYGGNQPTIYTALATSLSDAGRQPFSVGLDYAAIRYVETVQITVTITDSSGNAVNNVGITMYDSPHDSGLPDWLNTISDIINKLQLNTLYSEITPLYTNPQIYNGYTVGPAPSYAIQGRWSLYSTDPLNNNIIRDFPISQPDKLIELSLTPTFPKPDVYTFSVTDTASLAGCDYQPVGETPVPAGPDNPGGIQIKDAWLCLTEDTKTQPFSFQYVYEKDAGQDGDAGDSIGTALQIGHGAYTGFLHAPSPTDTNGDIADFYSFSTLSNEKVAFSVTSPPSADFGLTIYDNNNPPNVIGTRDLGAGATNAVPFTASSSGGTYYAKVYITSGWGPYSFSLTDTFQMSANPTAINLGLVGTGSTAYSSMTTSSPTDFSGQVTLSTPTVYPTVANGPTATLQLGTAYATVAVSPSVVEWTSWSPSNPSNAFAHDGQYASFDTANGGGATTVVADYGGYSLPSLPSGATITDVKLQALHYETGDQYSFLVEFTSGSQSTGYLPFTYSSSVTTWTYDITSLLPSLTPSDINAAQVLYGDEGGVFHHMVTYLDWLPLQVTYSYPTNVVTLTRGSSDTRTLTISSNTNTPAGIYTIDVTGTSSGGISLTIPITATVTDFQIAAPANINATAGQVATASLTTSALNGFSGTVTLSVRTPSGLTCPTPSPSTISLTPSVPSVVSSLTCSGSPGSYPITITGASGGLQHTASITVNIQDFALSLTPTSQTVLANIWANYTINTSSLYGFSGLINLTYTVPPGLNCDPPFFLVVNDPSQLQCKGNGGTYTVTTTAVSGPLIHTFDVTLTIQDFTMTTSSPSLTFFSGSSGTATINIATINGLTGTLSLTDSIPAGLTCQPLSSPSITLTSTSTTGSSNLTCTGSPGSYNLNVTGTFGNLVRTLTLPVNVEDFSITSSSGSVNIQQGGSLTLVLTIKSLGGFSGTVTLSPSAPSGITALPNATSVQLSAGGTRYVLLTITVSGSLATQGYSVSVTGTSTPLAHAMSVTVQVSNFSLSTSPSTVSIPTGGSGSVMVTATSINGYSGAVSFSFPSGIPACTSYSLIPLSGQLPAGGSISASLAMNPATTCTTSTNTISETVSSGTTGLGTSFTLYITDFTLQASPTSTTTLVGSPGPSTITINPVNGFTGTVYLAATISPSSGLTCYFTIGSITGFGTSTLYCYGSLGTYTVTVTGTVGSTVHSTTVTYTVRDFSLTVTPSQISIPDGRSGTVTIQATSINGYSGTLSLSFNNVYCASSSFGKPSLQLSPGGSNTSILTLSIMSNCYANQYNGYVAGYDSILQASRSTSLIVNATDFSIYSQIPSTVGIGGSSTLNYNVTYSGNNNYPGSIVTQTYSWGPNNCCLSTTIPGSFSVTKPDVNSVSSLVYAPNTQYQPFTDPWNGQGFYAQGRDWVFFINYGTCSGTSTNCLYYATSTNGATWTVYNVGLVTGQTFSVVTNGTSVFYVRYNGVDSQSGQALMLGIGTLHADGTIAWQPEKTVKPATSGVFWYAESMRLSTTGQIFVAYNRLTAAFGSGYPYVIHSNGLDYGTWQQEYQLYSAHTDDWRFSLVPLPNGQMYVLFWPYSGALRGNLWSNGAWGPQETIAPSSTPVQQSAFGFSTGNSTVYALWQEGTSEKIQFAIRATSGAWGSAQTIFIANTNKDPRWSASYDSLHGKWYIFYYSYSTNQIWEYSGEPGAWSGKTILYTTYGATSTTMIGSFYNTGQVNTNSNTLGLFWTQYDSSLSTLQLKFANATIYTGGRFTTTWPITSTGTGSGTTTLTVTAGDGHITRSITLYLTVNGYNVTYWYNPLTVNQGSSSAIWLQIFPEYGIPLTQATISPVSVTGPSTNCLTIYPSNPQYFNIGPIGGYDFPDVPVGASSSCALGNYTVTVKVNGTSVHSYDKQLSFTVTVVAPPSGGGGGGGSVGAGTLITLADGSRVPVQNLQVGMQLLSYDMAGHQYVVVTITKVVTVVTYNQMVIRTSTGKPLIVDQNPAQKLWVKLPDGTVTLMPVTELKTGYDLFDAVSGTWVPITSIHYQNGGQHLMYDIYTTAPGNYIANGYLDPLKT